MRHVITRYIFVTWIKRDEAFAWLKKAYVDHDVRLSFLKVESKWDSVHSDPRFVAMLKRIGLQ